MVKVKQHDERSHYLCFSEFDFDVKRENGGLRKAEEEVVSIVHVYDLLTLSVQYISDSSPKKKQQSSV